MEYYCYLRNIPDLLSDGKTLYERRFGVPFNGPVIPFRAMSEYHPVSAKDQSRRHQFGPKVVLRCTRERSAKETFGSRTLKN